MLTSFLSDIIKSLQFERLLPLGQYEWKSWEQEFSFIFRVTINEQVFFIKKLKPRTGFSNQALADKLCVEYEALAKYARFFSEHEHFNVPRPVFYSKEDLLLVTEEIKGISILDIGKKHALRKSKNDDSAIDVYNRTGKFLKVFHESSTYQYTANDLDQLEKYILKRLHCGIFSESQETKISDCLMKTCLEIKDNIQKYSKHPVHNDFNPANILSNEKDINVLDFGDFRIDHCFQDIVYFKLMLERYLESRIKYRQSAKRDLLKAFSNGYGIDYEDLSNNKLYNLFVLKNLAIFITTLDHRKEWCFPHPMSVKSVKNNLLKSLEYKKIKKRILLITEGQFTK